MKQTSYNVGRSKESAYLSAPFIRFETNSLELIRWKKRLVFLNGHPNISAVVTKNVPLLGKLRFS